MKHTIHTIKFSKASKIRKENLVKLSKDFRQQHFWGLHTIIDLHKCDAQKIRSARVIKRFVITLCKKIKMRRFGECHVVHFGEDPRIAGYSMMQLIETSLISGHFANESNSAYIDIFSCKYYDPYVVAEFAKNSFRADDCVMSYVLRK